MKDTFRRSRPQRISLHPARDRIKIYSYSVSWQRAHEGEELQEPTEWADLLGGSLSPLHNLIAPSSDGRPSRRNNLQQVCELLDV